MMLTDTHTEQPEIAADTAQTSSRARARDEACAGRAVATVRASQGRAESPVHPWRFGEVSDGFGSLTSSITAAGALHALGTGLLP